MPAHRRVWAPRQSPACTRNAAQPHGWAVAEVPYGPARDRKHQPADVAAVLPPNYGSAVHTRPDAGALDPSTECPDGASSSRPRFGAARVQNDGDGASRGSHAHVRTGHRTFPRSTPDPARAAQNAHDHGHPIIVVSNATLSRPLLPDVGSSWATRCRSASAASVRWVSFGADIRDVGHAVPVVAHGGHRRQRWSSHRGSSTPERWAHLVVDHVRGFKRGHDRSRAVMVFDVVASRAASDDSRQGNEEGVVGLRSAVLRSGGLT